MSSATSQLVEFPNHHLIAVPNLVRTQQTVPDVTLLPHTFLH